MNHTACLNDYHIYGKSSNVISTLAPVGSAVMHTWWLMVQVLSRSLNMFKKTTDRKSWTTNNTAGHIKREFHLHWRLHTGLAPSSEMLTIIWDKIIGVPFNLLIHHFQGSRNNCFIASSVFTWAVIIEVDCFTAKFGRGVPLFTNSGTVLVAADGNKIPFIYSDDNSMMIASMVEWDVVARLKFSQARYNSRRSHGLLDFDRDRE